jgi:hypothetical protein
MIGVYRGVASGGFSASEQRGMTMVKVLIYALLLSIALAGGISTGAEAQDVVVHTFHCPSLVGGWTDYERKIGSDPSFSLEHNRSISTRFRQSQRDGQNVYCFYEFTGDPKRSVTYTYAVKRKILSCKNVGKIVFTCDLKP